MSYFLLALIPISILAFMIYAEMRGRKQCPFCKEYINKEATKCPKCQSELKI